MSHSEAMAGSMLRLMRTIAIVVIKTGTMDSFHSGVSTTGSLVVVAITDHHEWGRWVKWRVLWTWMT